MGHGVRFDPRVIETPVGVLGDLLDELVGALAKSAKGGEGDRYSNSSTNIMAKWPREQDAYFHAV